MFMLVSSRDEQASMIVASNKPFSAWEIFGDEAVTVATIDRLIHHAEILSLKGDSYRPRTTASPPNPRKPTDPSTDRVGANPSTGCDSGGWMTRFAKPAEPRYRSTQSWGRRVEIAFALRRRWYSST